MNYNKKDLLQFIKIWFDTKGEDTKAVIEITADKNTLLCIELLVEALGGERVICISMPNIEKANINYEHFAENIGARHFTIPISAAAGSIYCQIKSEGVPISTQAFIRLPSRVKHTVLYTISDSINGFVVTPNSLVEILRDNKIEYSYNLLTEGVI